MASWRAVQPQHVQRAIDECDQLGRDAFLSRHGFGQARGYFLCQDGHLYDSKAILGVAYRIATGERLGPDQFSGGESGAAKVLRELGYQVTDGSNSIHAASVGSDAARQAWAEAAREALIATARRYHAVITYKELAEYVQSRTGVRTSQLMHYWIGDVLGRVARECHRRGEPILSSLCVNSAGSVGDGYGVAVAATTGETPGDLDDHAAHERLACHRFFGADLPRGGGVAALTPQLRAARARTRKVAQRPVRLCPTCHVAVPASGVCDFCD